MLEEGFLHKTDDETVYVKHNTAVPLTKPKFITVSRDDLLSTEDSIFKRLAVGSIL